MAEPVCYTLTPFALDLRPDADELERRYIPWLAHLEGPLRISVRTRPFTLAQPRQHLAQLLRPLELTIRSLAPLDAVVRAWDADAPAQLAALVAALPAPVRTALDTRLPHPAQADRAAWQHTLSTLGQPLWRAAWLRRALAHYTALDAQGGLRGLDHHLLCWLPPGVAPAEHAALLSRVLGTPVTAGTWPALLDGRYAEQRDHLAPLEPELPYRAILVATDLRGTWTLHTLGRLLALDLDLHLCLDIDPLDRTAAELRLDFVASALENGLRDPSAPRDAQAEQRLATARQFQDVADQGLHSVRLAVAVAAPTRALLAAAVREVRAAAAGSCPLICPLGDQGPLTQLFSTCPPGQITAFAPARIETSHGVAVMLPVGLRRPSRTDGIHWLTEGQTPIFFDPFRDALGRKRAAHAIVLGLTGAGKTGSAFALSSRMLTLGWQVVYFDPIGHVQRLTRACGRGGATYALDLHQRINILDPVVACDADGRPPVLAAQIDQVLTQLAILLGEYVPTGQGRGDFVPRRFDPAERILLDHALQQLYAPWAADLTQLTPAQAPILADLCAVLHTMPVRASLAATRTRFADELELWLVTGSLGAVYNGRTTVRWDFCHDVTGYNLLSVAEGIPRVLATLQAFAALHRYVMTRPDPARPLVVWIDEFGITLGQVPALAAFAAEAAKGWRTKLAALFCMDQNAETYLGVRGGVPPQALKVLFDNCTLRLIFQQYPEPAARLMAAIDGLQPHHVAQISGAQVGDVTLVWNSDAGGGLATEVFCGHVQLTPDEAAAFLGT